MKKHYKLKVSDNFLHKTPIVFDWSFAEIFMPLVSGATLVIAKHEGHKDPNYLAEFIKEKN